ncbi:tetratricopeptide repeat protein [Thauera humireducens]|uniref:tetratricopeptide repeat protein n=1 Tax=Thauera humireducens TaxID=1134435 RepID=UPI00311E81CF
MSARAAPCCPECGASRCRESRWRSHEEKLSHRAAASLTAAWPAPHRFIAALPVRNSMRTPRASSLATLVAAVLLAGIGLVAAALLTGEDNGEASVAAEQEAPPTSSTLEAAKAGDPEAQYRIGRAALLDTSHGKAAGAEAVHWLSRAAASGHSGAMLQLGKLYRSGVGVPQNYAYAEKWVRASANAGNTDGMVELGRLYRSGLGWSRTRSRPTSGSIARPRR